MHKLDIEMFENLIGRWILYADKLKAEGKIMSDQMKAGYGDGRMFQEINETKAIAKAIHQCTTDLRLTIFGEHGDQKLSSAINQYKQLLYMLVYLEKKGNHKQNIIIREYIKERIEYLKSKFPNEINSYEGEICDKGNK